MNEYGLIGYPLSHSFSPEYFAQKFRNEGLVDCNYEAHPLHSLDEFLPLIHKIPFKGLNVTIPYKESIMDYLDEISEEAQSIGAVNTIVIKRGKKIGYNTDVWGFEKSIGSILPNLQKKNKKALILGTGGASKAVAYVLQKYNIQYTLVSRDLKKGMLYQNINQAILMEHSLIVNTTPLGMFPDVQKYPDIPYTYLKKSHFLFDLVYNPKKTVFLTNGLKYHCRVQNGLDMFINQAEKSWEIWNQG